jgi:dCTP diphosphatase
MATLNENRRIVSHASSAIKLSYEDLADLQNMETWLSQQRGVGPPGAPTDPGPGGAAVAQRELLPRRLMSDPIARLQQELRAFARERDWEGYHSPRNLAALISSEAGELLALFRWDQDSVAERPEEVRRELADVFLGILRFADVAGIDLLAAADEKLRLNAEKYPPEPNSAPDVGGRA